MIFEQTFVWTTLVFVAIMVFYVGLLMYRQYSEIDYYEKQGIFVFPGSKRPIVGMVKEIKSYLDARKTDEVVEFEFTWFDRNLHRFVDKKNDNVPEWRGNFLRYMFGYNGVILSDPDVIQDIKTQE